MANINQVIKDLKSACCEDSVDYLKEMEILKRENAELKMAFLSMPNWLDLKRRPLVTYCDHCKYFDTYNVECEKGHQPVPPYSKWFCADCRPSVEV